MFMDSLQVRFRETTSGERQILAATRTPMRNGRPAPVGSTFGNVPGVDVELLVVGAGPAGVAAGLEAQRRGLSVVLVDKAGFPRDKTCGDGLTAGALRILDHLGFDVRALPSYTPVSETVLVSPTGREVAVPLPTNGEYAGVVPRIELDAALVRHARGRGVEIREHRAVTDARAEPDHVAVTFSDASRMTARWVIAADGHYSPTRRLLTGGANRGRARAELGTWHAYRQYFTGVDDRRLWVLFEEDLLPGYAWVFPVGGPDGEGTANVGFGVLRGGVSGRGMGKTLATQWRTLTDRPNVRRALGPHAQPVGSARAWPIPGNYDRARLAGHRVLYVGDAAGVVDPMTGEGIGQALETGALAAEAVATGPAGARTELVAEHYRDAVDQALGRDLRFAAALQGILRSPIGTRAALGAAALTPWTRRNFARWMFEDYPRALVLTPDRWRRGMFSTPGAYRSG
jgi:geranylgeranyl reductase family protein